jgi:capsule polysaccharide export protein KpsE/RkpR
MSEPGPATFDFVGLVRGHWRRVGLVTALVVGGAVAYALLAPKWYRAQLVVVPAPASRGMPMMAGAGGNLSQVLDLSTDLGLGSSDVERIAAVLKSGSVTDSVIEKFGLMARYRDKYLEDARKDLWEHCGVKADRKPGIVVLSCEDKDPEMARRIVAHFGEYGNKVFRRVYASAAHEERQFLEKRVEEARRDMLTAAQKLRDFQERNRIIDISEQSRALVSSIATLRGELVAKQIQLSYLDSFSSHDEATAEQLRRHIGILDAKLQAMTEARAIAEPKAEEPASRPARSARRGKGTDASGLFPPAMNVPKLRFELEELFRDLKVQETLYLLLSQRCESARVSEARDTSTFQILDLPTTPTKKARPRRLLITLGGLLFGLLLGTAWAVLPGWWRAVRAPHRRSGSPPAA